MNPPASPVLPPAVSAALSRIALEIGQPPPPLDPADASALAAAAKGDAALLKRWLKRRFAGEPLPYILGEFSYRGRRFRIDKRAYITDPESMHLVESVLAWIDRFTAKHGRAPVIVEFGCGCGTLGVTLKLERPAISLVALDIDPDPLELARANAATLHADVQWLESDLFDAWPHATPPDLVFGDPPWGTEEDLYDDQRDAAYYHAMPAISAFPLGGRTGAHAQVLRAIAALRWPSYTILNCGVLPVADVRALGQATAWHEIMSPTAGISVLHCRMH